LRGSEDDGPSFERLGIFYEIISLIHPKVRRWRSHAEASTQTSFFPTFSRSQKIINQVLKGQGFFVR
jgi:hypothetical protein